MLHYRDNSSAVRFSMRWRWTSRLGRQDSNLCIACEFAKTLSLGREDSNLCILESDPLLSIMT
jgi:hypothetical protein